VNFELEIPIETLEVSRICEIIVEFVTRDGTDLTDTIEKVRQVVKLLQSGEAIIVRDEEGRNVNIILKNEYQIRKARYEALWR